MFLDIVFTGKHYNTKDSFLLRENNALVCERHTKTQLYILLFNIEAFKIVYLSQLQKHLYILDLFIFLLALNKIKQHTIT